MSVRRVLGIVAAFLAIVVLAIAAFVARRFFDSPDLVAEWRALRFERGYLLALLAVVPFVLHRGTLGEDARMPRLRLGTVAPLLRGPRGVRTRLRDLPGILRAAAMVCFVVALAKPVSLMRPTDRKESGIDIVLVLDLSGSMKAVMDGAVPVPSPKGKVPRRPTRIDVAKDVILDFIGRRKTDRIGAVVFGKAAYVLAPPTLDYQLLSTLVARIDLEMVDGSGTAIGDALGVAAARMRRSNAKSKAIVLLTDGDNNAGTISPEYGAHLAASVGSRVYTVQIGGGDDVDVETGTDWMGNPRYERARFPVNPELLRKIAESTGGVAHVATDAEALRKSMHDVLDRLEKTTFEAEAAAFEDLFPLFLLPGAILVALDALLRAWVFRRFP